MKTRNSSDVQTKNSGNCLFRIFVFVQRKYQLI